MKERQSRAKQAATAATATTTTAEIDAAKEKQQKPQQQKEGQWLRFCHFSPGTLARPLCCHLSAHSEKVAGA